jgi:hypothetical protein
MIMMSVAQFDADLRALAEKAKTRYPGEDQRIERGLLLALNGHVELLPDGTATVQSSKDAEVQYQVRHGHCDCPDFARAPDGRCKHAYARALVRKAARPRVAYRVTYKGEPGQAIRDEQMRVWLLADASDTMTRLYDRDLPNTQFHGRVDLAAAQAVTDLARTTLQAIAEGHSAPGMLAC